ncbi:MAG: PIG-L deacetylase family protein [Candidatus Eiseniibacteriota bacterium]
MAKRSVAVIVAHPDDEVLLAGGAMARHVTGGDAVRTLFLATGAAARGGRQTAYINKLRAQAARAAKVLGASPPSFCDFPDNRMDTVPLLDVVQAIEAFLAKAPAAVVYTHHAGDLNVDHRIVHQAVVTACRPLPGGAVRQIYAGETLSSTEWSPVDRFAPTTYVAIERFLEQKLKALACYEDEIRDFPHPRSIEAVRALATVRGAEAGLDAAEAFYVVRDIHG